MLSSSVAAAGLLGSAAPAASAAPALCGSLAGQPPHVTKVMWIFMENRSYGTSPSEIPGDPSASYIDNTLIAQCGSTSAYDGITHPSYPNYLAATSGSTQGTTSDTLGYFPAASIFGQVDPSWRSYEEFIPANCSHAVQAGSGTQWYGSKHNPASSYSALPVGAPSAGDCSNYDEPLGTTTSGPLAGDVAAGTLPAFSFVTPGFCDDMHAYPPGVAGCTDQVAGGDAWLATWIPILTSGPDYTSGNLVIDIAWDEARGGTAGQNCVGSASSTCLVPNIVISPYTPHVVSATSYSHYSLLKMTETLLGKPYLGQAADPATIDMCLDFGLCPQDAGVPPTASFTASCSGATCMFDASGSSAPGSGITAFRWDFGDGTTGAGEMPQHGYAAPGNYQVTLTVTNESGLTSTSSQQVTAGSGGPLITFVAAAHVTGNSPNETVTIPAVVRLGDGLVLVASGAGSQSITAPAGWALACTKSSSPMVTSVWDRVATANDAGGPVTLAFSTSNRKGDAVLLAYRGTAASAPVSACAAAGASGTASSATTPQITVGQAGSWVISAWSAKSSTVTKWTGPAGVSVRDGFNGLGSGRITMLAADSGGPVATGTAGGLTASTDQPFSAETAVTALLAPG